MKEKGNQKILANLNEYRSIIYLIIRFIFLIFASFQGNIGFGEKIFLVPEKYINTITKTNTYI